MRFGLGATVSKVATVMRAFGIPFLKNNLKLFFDFKNTDLEHVGTGCLTNLTLSSQNVEIDGTNFRFGSSQDFTIMLWFRNNTGNGGVTLFDNSDGSSIGYKCTIKSNGRISNTLKGDGGTANDQDSGGDTTKSLDGNWHHLAIVFDRDKGRFQYLDGVEDRSKGISSVGDIDNTFPIHFMNNNQATVGNNGFDGSIKNACIYKRALTLNEIHNIMFKTYSELKGTELTHLQGWWALESDTTDSTGNQNATRTAGTDQSFNTTIYGNHTPTKPRGVDNSSAALADQIGSGSASFDGTDDYINCGDADNLSFGNESSDSAFSWSAWIKFPSGITDSNFIISKDNSSNVEYQLFLNTSFQIKARCHDSTLEKQRGLTGTTALSENIWHHIAWTYDGTGGDNAQSGMNIYLDGVLETVSAEIDASSYTAMHNTSAPLYIGLTDRISDKTFKGNIAQVGLWSRALSQEEVQEISQKQYSELTTSEKTNIVSWWALDEVFLGSNISTSSASGTLYEVGQIVEDKAGTLSTILVDNYDTLDNWEGQNANSSISRNADGNLVITASGGSAGARLKSSFTTLETDTMYLAELAVAGGTDTSIYFRLDDEAYADTKYGNGYLTPNTDASNATPECMSVRFKSDSTNTGLYVQIGNVDDTKTAIIKSFKLYKIVSGNYGVLTDV